MNPAEKHQPLDLPTSSQLDTPLHRYVNAFNGRDQLAMASVFADNLLTIHPSEPEVDVDCAEPFLARMRKLWERDISYRLLRTISHGDLNQDGEVWGELVALNSDHSPLATEVVIYRVRDGLVFEICIYKLMKPTHPAYQS
jgi:hypothetical protein